MLRPRSAKAIADGDREREEMRCQARLYFCPGGRPIGRVASRREVASSYLSC